MVGVLGHPSSLSGARHVAIHASLSIVAADNAQCLSRSCLSAFDSVRRRLRALPLCRSVSPYARDGGPKNSGYAQSGGNR